jgi:hypothetical protein
VGLSTCFNFNFIQLLLLPYCINLFALYTSKFCSTFAQTGKSKKISSKSLDLKLILQDQHEALVYSAKKKDRNLIKSFAEDALCNDGVIF